jgi:hypothetical protein
VRARGMFLCMAPQCAALTKGLQEGEQVLASVQFLIDSEARLRSVLGNMAAPASARRLQLRLIPRSIWAKETSRR